MLEKMAKTDKSVRRARLYRADTLAHMGDIAKNFKDEAYADLPKINCQKAYDIYSEFPLDELAKYQKKLLTDCCIVLSKASEEHEKYRQKAFELLAMQSELKADLYYDYYSLYIGKCMSIANIPLSELTDEEQYLIAVTTSLIAHHMFFGLSEASAKKRYTENRSIAQNVSTFYSDKEIISSASLYNVLYGYCCEKQYSKTVKDNSRETVADNHLNKLLTEKINSLNISLITEIINNDNIIEYIRKKQEKAF